MRVAIYARVSTRHQDREQTIDSQLAALRAWVEQHAHDLRPEHVFTDPGHSGGRLDRPGLDRLRDAAAGGEFDTVAVYSPDRLARRYIHHALLLEEFRKAGCAVAFVHRPISDDPHDQLLLQIQGAVAEYERSVIAERFRRGKLQRARAGHWVAGRAAYGYRYVPKRDGVPGYLVIDDAQAEAVRAMFRWLVDDRLSLRAIAQRLADSPWRPKNGKRLWSVVVIHRILSDPLYAGTGYANRFVLTPSPDPRRRARRPDARTCRRERPREEWIPIPVPAIIDTATHERAVAQLARNAAMCRRNSRHFYLLRCLLSCGRCGRSMVGISHPGRHRHGDPHRYYKCTGQDVVCPKYQARCGRRLLQADPLEAAVWDHVHRLIADPGTLRAQFDARAATPDGTSSDGRGEAEKWAAQLRRLDREEVRLVDAYQAEVISLDELKERREQLRVRRQAAVAQRDAAMPLPRHSLVGNRGWRYARQPGAMDGCTRSGDRLAPAPALTPSPPAGRRRGPGDKVGASRKISPTRRVPLARLA
jgi:site-specific DNA recombinase